MQYNTRFSEFVARLTIHNYVGLNISTLKGTRAFAQYLYAAECFHQVITPYIQPTKHVDS